MEFPTITLKPREERRIKAGHLWIYSNEIDTRRTPLTAFAAGSVVAVEANDGRFLGYGYLNPNSLIAVRLLSRSKKHPPDRSLLVHRLKVALSLRERCYPQPFYRLVYGESDGLPGLVVDRFGDVVVVQLNTAGMEAMKTVVVEAIERVLKPQTILLRNDSSSRDAEGLERYVEVAKGEAPERIALEENGVKFLIPGSEGQKTGWFFDHRENRARIARFMPKSRVLDLFSYVGGWGVQAAAAGAAEVVCVDSSALALDYVETNAELNGLKGRVSAIEGDAFDALKALKGEGEKFDLVIVDPPAFIKRKKDLKKGLEAYQRLNRMAMQLLGKDGLIVSASCSHHLQRDALRDLLGQGARHLDRQLQIIDQGHQGLDHPIHPAIPETEYIKCLIGRVVLA